MTQLDIDHGFQIECSRCKGWSFADNCTLQEARVYFTTTGWRVSDKLGRPRTFCPSCMEDIEATR